MQSDEMQLLKAATVRIDENTVLIHTLRYHTEPHDKNSVEPRDRTKNRYQWIARVQTIDSIKKTIEDLKDPARALVDFKWPDDPDWNGVICFNKSRTNKTAARWLEVRTKKILDWDIGMKVFDGWQKGGKRAGETNPAAAYETEDFTAPDGTKVSLRDKATLLKYVGKNLTKEILMKSKLKKEQPK